MPGEVPGEAAPEAAPEASPDDVAASEAVVATRSPGTSGNTTDAPTRPGDPGVDSTTDEAGDLDIADDAGDPNDPFLDSFGVESGEPDGLDLQGLVIVEPVEAGYSRRGWRHWTDDDRDCQNTRAEVLIAESSKPVTFSGDDECHVVSGRWRDPYTGKTFRASADLQIDHVVPLNNAYRTGGHAWSAKKRQKYANDLGDRDHLIAVASSANTSKGARGPEDWLPPNRRYRCEYIHLWIRIKQKWQLGFTAREGQALTGYLDLCSRGRIPDLPR